MLFDARTAWLPVRKGSVVVEKDREHIELEASEMEVVGACCYSCPFGCKAQAVAAAELGTVVVLLGGSNWPRTCYCSYGVVALEIEVSEDIGSWVKGHTDSKLPHGLELCEPALELLVPAAC